MITGLYSAASGMVIQERVQDVIAQNLAGSMTPGYRREDVVIRSFPDVLLSETYRGLSRSTDKPRYSHAIGRIGTGAGVDWSYVDHSPGSYRYTGDNNHMAISGDGFFAVATPDGTRFTRQGSFMVDRDGYLVTQQGFRLLGQGVDPTDPTAPAQRRPIQVGTQEFYVNHFGEIFAKVPDAQNVMRNQFVDQIAIADFEDKDRLFREPGSMFRVEEGDEDNFAIPDRYQVMQGYIENSNTLPTTEMVKLIDSYRIFEASSRVIRSLDQTLGRAVNDVGRPSG